jgi:hypothetical protein
MRRGVETSVGPVQEGSKAQITQQGGFGAAFGGNPGTESVYASFADLSASSDGKLISGQRSPAGAELATAGYRACVGLAF